MILFRYTLRRLLFNYFGALGALAAVNIAVDALYHVDAIAGSGHGVVGGLLLYALASVPQVVFLLAPAAYTVAAMLVFAGMEAGGELTAVKAAGAPVWRLFGAVFAGCAISVAVMFGVGEGLGPLAARSWGKLRTDRTLKRVALHDSKAGMVRVVRYLLAERVLLNVTVIQTDARGRVRRRVSAARARLDDGLLKMKNARVTRYAEDGSPLEIDAFRKTLAIPSSLEPLDFEALETDMRHTNIFLLMRLARRYPHLRHLQVQFYARLALLLANFVLVMVGLPFALGLLGRSGVLNVGAALLLCFIYFAVTFFFWELGNRGQLSPVTAAWLANILFVSVGATIVDVVRT